MGRLWYLAYLVLAASTLRAAATQPSPRLQELAQQAAGARDSGHIDDALALYRRGVGLQPSWSEGWWNLATLLYDRNAFGPARESLARFVKLEPKAAPGWALRGLCEFELKEYPASLDDLQRALRLGLDQGPLAKVTSYHAALLLTKSGHFTNALQLLSKLATDGAEDRDTILATGLAALRLPLFPHDVPTEREMYVYRVGHAMHENAMRREPEARKELEALIAENQGAPELHNLLGQVLVVSDADAAIAEWKRELAISPEHTPAKLQLAFEYLKRGEAAAGLPYAREAVAKEPDSFVAHNALGRILLGEGDQARGISELELAKKLAPDSLETRVELASAYARAGRSQDAARERAEFLRLKNAR